MPIKTITSPTNPRIKDAAKLRDARHRAKQGRFLIDGARELTRALRGGVPLVELFVCVAACKSAESLSLLNELGQIDADVWNVTPAVLEKIAFGKRQDGIVAVAQTPRKRLADLAVAVDKLVAVVVGLEKPGNVGAVLRSADATGAGAVIVVDGRTDLFNPNCIRASLGTIFTQPVCEAATDEALSWLRARGGKIVAARTDAQESYSAIDYREVSAIVLGSETSGLSDAWHAPDILGIKLPMRGTADSLNVSAAAAAIFYEALRQRELPRR